MIDTGGTGMPVKIMTDEYKMFAIGVAFTAGVGLEWRQAFLWGTMLALNIYITNLLNAGNRIGPEGLHDEYKLGGSFDGVGLRN